MSGSLLLLCVGLLIGVFADPDPTDEQFHRIPKNRDEDKCYDDSGRAQVIEIKFFHSRKKSVIIVIMNAIILESTVNFQWSYSKNFSFRLSYYNFCKVLKKINVKRNKTKQIVSSRFWFWIKKINLKKGFICRITCCVYSAFFYSQLEAFLNGNGKKRRW